MLDNFEGILDEVSKEVLKEACKKKKFSVDTDKTKVMRTCSKTGKKLLVKSFSDAKEAKSFMKDKNDNGKSYFIEANIEIKDKNASNITVDGKKYEGNLGSLKTDYPKHFKALRLKLKADGKTLANFGGDSPAIDIVAKADGTVVVNYDA